MAKQSSGFWAGFRDFRYTRPFWAGLFTMLAGGEILLFPLTPISSLIQLGIGAISGVLFGVGLVVLGLFMWFSPPNRTLAGVLTILIALASFITTNLGGLIVGMLLGLVGGGLCLAWTPKAAPPKRPKKRRRFPWSKGPGNGPPGRGVPPEDPAEATTEVFGAADTESGRAGSRSPRPGRRRPLQPDEYPEDHAVEPAPRPSSRPRPSRANEGEGRPDGGGQGRVRQEFRRTVRGRRVAGLATLMAAALLGVTVATPGVAAAQDCVLGIFCQNPPPSSGAEPTTTQAPRPPARSTTTEGGGGSTSSPSATSGPAPGGPLGELSDAGNGALGGLPVPGLPALTPAQLPFLAGLLPQFITPALPTTPAQDGIRVSGLISNTKMDTLTVTNFRFLGVVTHQVAGGGTIRALRVVVDSTDIGNLSAMLPGPESSMLVNQRSGALNASSGELILDFTKLKITLFGVLPLEFSFAFPPPPLIPIPVLSGTDVDIDFVQLDSSPNIPGVVVAIGPPSAGAQTTDTGQTLDSQASLTTLVGLASLLNQPNLLAPYGLTDAQAKQAMAEYEKDPAAAQRQGAAQPGSSTTERGATEGGADPSSSARPAPTPAPAPTQAPLLGPGA